MIALLVMLLKELLVFSVILVSTIWVYKNSKKENYKYPGLWASAVLIFWIPTFPIYILKRLIDRTSLSRAYKTTFSITVILLGITTTGYRISKNQDTSLRDLIQPKPSEDSQFSSTHHELSLKAYQMLLKSDGKSEDSALKEVRNEIFLNAKNSITSSLSKPFEKFRYNMMIEHLSFILSWCAEKQNSAKCGGDDYLLDAYTFLEKNFRNESEEKFEKFISLQIQFARYYRQTERSDQAALILKNAHEKSAGSSCSRSHLNTLDKIIYSLSLSPKSSEMSMYEKIREGCEDQVDLQKKKQEM